MKTISEISYGDLTLNSETRQVVRAGYSVHLSNKEFGLLEYFMTNQGRVVSKVELFENVWDSNAFIVTNTIEVHIRNLRKKLDIPFTKPLIHTVHCVGYRFF